MSITQKELSQIAYLARLKFDEDALAESTIQMNNILSFVEQLSEVETDDIMPMAHPLEMTQRLRIDEITQVDEHKLFQSIAPQTQQQLYLVPTVIE